MVGVLLTLLFAVGAMGVGQFLLSKLLADSDPAESVGVSGLVGLGALGLLTLLVGLMPNGLQWGVGVVGVAAVAGFYPVYRMFDGGKLRIARPEGPWIVFPLVLAIGALFALVGVLAPSDTLDWDTLAYHLAVPKIWLHAGQIQYIPYIHHSNFPFTVEDLFIWGLQWGGPSGAKAFTLAFFFFGIIALFGFARSKYGGQAGWWAALAFATIPVVLWESGTGYIDVPHGLFAGLGILYAAKFLSNVEDRRAMWLSAICLGFAAGTKYTGLQTIGVVGLVVVVAFASRKKAADGVKTAVLIGAAAMAVGGIWYVKTAALTGNPVYPFFYERLGGKNWDQRRADVYRNEQQNFGSGTLETRHSPMQLGNAILGLAYQPGRYVNPQEDKGNGTPLGAIGCAVLSIGLLWALSGAAGVFERAVLGTALISLLIWFFLSQQSRYVVPLCVPLAVIGGGGIRRLKTGTALAAVISVQAAYSLYLVYDLRFQTQSQAAFGKISAEDYQKQTIAFFEASQEINKLGDKSKVALYDEVFGSLLDVPYVWANPPHSLLIPYDSLNSGAEYAAEMKKQGFTHIYISTSPVVKDRAFVAKWTAAMGLNGDPVPFSDEERKAMLANWQDKWMVLLSDAVAQHAIVPVKGFKHGILFSIP